MNVLFCRHSLSVHITKVVGYLYIFSTRCRSNTSQILIYYIKYKWILLFLRDIIIICLGNRKYISCGDYDFRDLILNHSTQQTRYDEIHNYVAAHIILTQTLFENQRGLCTYVYNKQFGRYKKSFTSFHNCQTNIILTPIYIFLLSVCKYSYSS